VSVGSLGSGLVPDPSSGTSVAALVVSICSAAMAFFGFLANRALYKFSGARLKVQLVFCYAETGDERGARLGPSGRHSRTSCLTPRCRASVSSTAG
jgi:hypothetical protein